MPQFPRSAYDLTGGLLYFARMCDKVRLHAAGQLPPEYHEFLGKGFDGRLCGFLRIDYTALRDLVLAGATDDQALAWAEVFFGPIADIHRLTWNSFARKRGWRDDDGGTDALARFKADSGFADRDDISTYFDYYDIDEKRRP